MSAGASPSLYSKHRKSISAGGRAVQLASLLQPSCIAPARGRDLRHLRSVSAWAPGLGGGSDLASLTSLVMRGTDDS